MNQFTNITIDGTDGESVFITNQNTTGIFESMFMVDGRVGRKRAEHKTLKGSKNWAAKVLESGGLI